ncbi:hypothetical protein A5886_002559 [Enterococcus sp. 8G7_MSG3316]|uniref:Major facilitator superfamily (MFS) profile domain-containing protein n=1 Tax=Candidatus Enterococcus testudinis TaxID=1834191 RepID=A0A242A959_9ENTE|nr:hypothetical protein [Enterococcus sp. 8G7_MSG3316]OTN77459.1 hypothetical protein A5886_002559 [Enterococcus sp. 8G7_MSG3316]
MKSIKSHQALFILSNTLTIVPYLFFLSISKEQTLAAILSFVLYYTFKMTGVFFLQTIQRFSITALLTISLLIGTIGSLFGLLSGVWENALLPAAALFGLSAAWLPPADFMYRQASKKTEVSLTNDWRFALVYLLLLLGAMQLPHPWKTIGLFAGYLLLFISAAYQSNTISYRPQGVWRMVKQLTGKQLFLYVLFFALLFVLRTGRLLQSDALFEWAIFGFGFLFAGAMITLSYRRKSWDIPLYLNVFTFLHGVAGNFVFLFGSVYVGARFGQSALTSHVYLPYAIGLFSSMAAGAILERKLSRYVIKTYILGLVICILLFCFDGILPFALVGISFFNAGINRWLGQQYQAATFATIEHRSIAKYATQSKGSLTHQFLLMLLLFGMTQLERLPEGIIFQLSNNTKLVQQQTILALLTPVKWISAVSIILLFICGFFYLNKELHQSRG